MVGRTLMELPLHCARLAAAGQQPDANDINLLVNYTVFCAEMTDWKRKGHRFEVAAAAPGYLFTKVGEHHYFVPYGLVDVFPNHQQLTTLEQLIPHIRINEQSALCLSGSSTFIGMAECITDIDFCEYVDVQEALASHVNQKTSLAHDTRLVCVKFDGSKTYRPFSGNIAITAIPASPVKLDFVSQTAQFGAIVVTNLVLPLTRTESDSAMMKLSFQYQESVILKDPEALPKRSLMRPDDIGAYLNWLRAQVIAYLGKAQGAGGINGAAALKALKRALSWFLMLGLGREIQDILNVLNAPIMNDITLFERSEEVTRLLSGLDGEQAAALRADLKIESVGAAGQAELDAFYKHALGLATVLLDEMELLMRGNELTEVAA
jgi:hypothetical protein